MKSTFSSSSVFLVLFSFFLLSCGGGNREEGGEVFRYNEAGGINSLDPAFSRNVENIWAVHQLFNGLVRMNSDLEVVGDIAEDWEITEEGTVYTFRLRDSVLFHEHEAFPDESSRLVTAEDLEYSIERVMDPETASPGAYIFDRLVDDEENGVEAIDERTLQLRLKEPFPPFLGLLTMKYASVVPQEVIEEIGKKEFAQHPIGTGPFKMDLWEEDVKLLMVRNPEYFETDEKGNRLPYLDGVSISFFKERSVAFSKFRSGRFDFLSGVDGSFKEEVLNDEGELRERFQGQFDLVKGPYLKTDYLGFLVDTSMERVREHPIAEPKVRQAINKAIDREGLVRHLRRNVGHPAEEGFIPKGLPGHGEEKKEELRYEPEVSRTLLKEAGYPNGEGVPPLKLSLTKNYSEIGEFILNELDDIGIEVNVNVVPPSNHREHVARSSFLFFRKSWVADHPDAQNFLSLFHSSNFSPEGPNYTHFSNERFDSLYTEAMDYTDPEERAPLYKEMDRILMEHVPVVPLFYDESIRMIHPWVKGYEANAMNLLDLRKVSLEHPDKGA